jgi:hypothetical protein
MNGRHFHHQPRSRVIAIGPIAHADEDDDQIETWMIGQGQEASVLQPGFETSGWAYSGSQL